MRARDVKGRTIVGIEQSRIFDHGRDASFMALDAIVLDDGSRIVLGLKCYTDAEGFNQDAVDATVVRL